ncbi:MAG: S8 family serine peptidase [candidate division WOR-3 bacterium]
MKIKLIIIVGLFTELSYSYPISLDKIKFDPLKEIPNIPEELKAEKDNDVFLLQLNGPAIREWKNILKEKGVKIYAYIPEFAYLVKIEPQKIEEIKNLDFVRWIGDYHPYYKIAPECENIKDIEENDIMVKEKGFLTVYDPLYINLLNLKSFVLYLLPDADIKEVSLRISNICEIRHILPYPSNRIIIWTSPENLNSIAKIKEVYYIFPYYPKTLFNSTTKYVLQSYVLTVQANETPLTGGDTVVSGSLPLWDRNIKGQGQIVTVMDTGVDYYSCWFRDPEGDPPGPNHIVIYDYTNEGGDLREVLPCAHGTHVSGTVAGDPTRGGANSIAEYQGHAYMGKIYMQDIGYVLGIRCLLRMTNFYNSVNTAYNKGSRIHTNSWGYTGGFGDYIYEAIDVDIFSFINQDFLFIVSAGNSGPNANTVTPPSTAKDCISVGSTWRHSYDGTADNISDWSSRGPTDDNRYKPDLMTPGGRATQQTDPWRYFITSAYPADNWGQQTCGIGGMFGTSMAAPACAGCAALVRQYYLEGYYPNGVKDPANSIYPSGALIKATLLLSTRDMTGVLGYPNYNEGWGRICLDDALYFSGDARKLWIDDHKNGLDTGDSVLYRIQVNSSSQSFKIVLVWHDTAAAANANPTLVNNLNLRVKDPSGNIYWGNYFSGGQSVPGGSPDARNNVEVFLLNTPQVGIYQVAVKAANVPTGAKQPYAITAAGDITFLGTMEIEFSAKCIDEGILLLWGDLSDAKAISIEKANGRGYEKITELPSNSREYIDKNVENGKTYTYRLIAHYDNRDRILGPVTITYISPIPKELTILSMSRNIIKNSGFLRIAVPKKEKVDIEIYDPAGRICKKVFSGYLERGIYEFKIDIDSKGVYFLIVKDREKRIREKLLFM